MGNVVTYTFQDNHNAWHMTSFMQKYSMTPIISYLISIIAYILQWHTGVYEENFDVNIKIAQASQLR